MFERDVEEVAGAAGGVEDFGVAELVMERFELFNRLVALALLGVKNRGDADGVPFLADRLDNRGHDEAFDVRPRRVARPQLVPLDRVECPLQQRAKNRRFNVLPLFARRLDQ